MSQFHQAVDVVFENWTALQLAVSQGAGGAQSKQIAKWMVDATVQWFGENKDLESDEVEDFLLDIVNNEFNVLIDDGSVSEISRQICDFYRLDNSGKREELLQKLEKMPKKADLSACKVDNTEDSTEPNTNEDAEDEEMEVDAKPVQDPDGWTVVSRKKK